jgi:hypothetical protein
MTLLKPRLSCTQCRRYGKLRTRGSCSKCRPSCPRVNCRRAATEYIAKLAPQNFASQTAHPRQLQQVQAQLPQGVPPPRGDLRQPLQQRPPRRPQLLLLRVAKLQPGLQHKQPQQTFIDSPDAAAAILSNSAG